MNLPTAVEAQLLERITEWMGKGSPDLEGIGSTTRTGLSCPSATNIHGDKVFAVFDECEGELRYLPVAVVVPEIAKTALDMDAFALKNRLVGKCITLSCRYWQGSCRLGHFVSKVELSIQITSRQCAIKDTCRWRKENGSRICGTCAFVRNIPVHVTSLL